MDMTELIRRFLMNNCVLTSHISMPNKDGPNWNKLQLWQTGSEMISMASGLGYQIKITVQ